MREGRVCCQLGRAGPTASLSSGSGVSCIWAMGSKEDTSSHEFAAYVCGVDDNDDAISVGFSRDPADEHTLDSLIVQRGKDPQEDAPGIEGVYVEIPIQRHVVYGGITEASLRRDSFTVHFDEHAVHKMGHLHQIVARFDLPDREFSRIRDALRFVFAGCSCYTEINETLG